MDSALNFCFRCTECCKNSQITVSKEEIEVIKQVTGITLKTKQISQHRFQTTPPCPFLKGDSCSIYEIRPCQCRLYHCGKQSKNDQTKPLMSEIKFLMQTNPAYNQYRIRLDEEGVAWGNKHGWNWRKQ